MGEEGPAYDPVSGMIGSAVGFAVGHRWESGCFITGKIILQGFGRKRHPAILCQSCQKGQLFPEGLHIAVVLCSRPEEGIPQLFNRKTAVVQCCQIDADKTVSDLLSQRDGPVLHCSMIFLMKKIQAGLFVPD